MKLQYRWLLAAGASVALVGTLGTQALAQPARARAPFRTPARFSGQTTGGVPGSSTVRPPGSARSRLPGGPVPAGFQPQSVTFISGPDGWVLGAAPCGTLDCLAVLRTRDGGKTWRSVSAPPVPPAKPGGSPSVYELAFADSRNGFAYGPQLYATHDGGATWHRVRMPGEVLWLAAGGGTAYAVVKGTDLRTRVYRSPVSRTHWSRVTSLPPPSSAPPTAGPFAGQNPITFYGKTAWIFLGDHLYTTKTGASWQRERDPCPGGWPARGLAAQDQSRVSVECEQSGLGAAYKIIFNSRDGGHTFTRVRQAPPFIGDGSTLARPGPGNMVLACVSTRAGANLIYSSGDGGRTWRTSLELPPGTGWFDFGFATALRGAAVEGAPVVGSHLYLTSDGGASWHRARF